MNTLRIALSHRTRQHLAAVGIAIAAACHAGSVLAEAGKLVLNMRDADIRSMVQWVADVTGKNLIVHKDVQGKVTVLSAEPVTPEQAYQVFLSALEVNGFAAVESGGAIKIVPQAMANASSPQVSRGVGGETVITVIRAKNVPASQLATNLRPLVPQTGMLTAYPETNSLIVASSATNVQRVNELVKLLDQAGNLQFETVRLQHANAQDVEKNLQQLIPAIQGSEGYKFVNMAVDTRTNTILLGGDPANRTQVRNIIAVASGKGGVGKSTTAVNLALALAAEGASVGMLDADIYGPSQPLMLGVSGRPESTDGKTMEPLIGHGLQASSIGFMIEPDTPMVWRGPMVTQALEQLLRDTNWRDLDYLVVDLPPGTGDIHLTLAQKIPVTGAVIVTTPQDIALLDARKGLKMFEKVGIPILGIVENMAMHTCTNCGHTEHIFGEGGGERMSREYGVEYLGGLPLDIRIREQADSGRPTVVAEPQGDLAATYRRIARRVAVRIAQQARDMSLKFPSIVVQKT